MMHSQVALLLLVIPYGQAPLTTAILVFKIIYCGQAGKYKLWETRIKCHSAHSDLHVNFIDHLSCCPLLVHQVIRRK